MNRILITLFVLAIVAIGSGTAWYLVETRNQVWIPVTEEVTSEEESVADYHNDTYGFRIAYSPEFAVVYNFAPEALLGTVWRFGALPEASGVPVVAFTSYETQSENSYPRAFTAQLRIGVSTDPREVARCLDAENGEEKIDDAQIGGRTWTAFSFGDAAMMRYVRGTSYRIVHENACLALEQVRAGSQYRDDIPSERDISDDVLDAEYAKLSQLISGFTFVR